MSTPIVVEQDQPLVVLEADAPPVEAITPQRTSWFRTALPTLAFLGRRLLSSAIVLLGATFIVYMALTFALDFLEDLRASPLPAEQVDMLIAQRTALLNLDTPPIIRYFQWLGQVLTGNFGQGWNQFVGQDVTSLLGARIPVTISLVLVANIVQILFGILVGIVSALRQYTRFDYGVTFMSFVLFSLPSFWVAVLLKTWGAIGFNDFLNAPHFPLWTVILVPLALGGLWSAIIGGVRRMRWIVFLVGTLATLVLMLALTRYITIGETAWAVPWYTGWLQDPRLGIPGVALIGLAIALSMIGLLVGFNRLPGAAAPVANSGVTERMDADGVVYEAVAVDTDAPATSGLRGWINDNRALCAALTTVLVGAILMNPLQWLFVGAGWGRILLLGLLALAVGALIGFLWGGYDRRVSMRISALTALGMGVFMFVDRVMQVWAFYSSLPQINNRPISTIGSTTPGVATSALVQGDFWVMQLDAFTHVLLPTVSLVLIGFAGYTRYTRGSMLEVMNQDYIRTARAKGLPERVVTVRHAFRNALIPLATIIPLDLAGLIGGAVITEQIFGWQGMGQLFIQAVRFQEINVIMGYFLVIGTMLVIGSIVVDFLYALLDPRIRVDA